MQRSGQITVTGVTKFPNIWCITIAIKAHPDNTDTIWIGNDGNDTLASTSGYPINPGEAIIINAEGNINTLYAVADVSDEKLCWIVIRE